MEKQHSANNLLSALHQYKQKYYTNLLLKGILIAGALFLAIYISLNTLEYLGRFNSVVRTVLFFSFVVFISTTLFYWVFIPISRLLKINRQLSDEEAALQIGHYFPDINDKLLNTIQLNNTSDPNNSLLMASIAQRTRELSIFKFTEAIDLSENRRYLKYILIPLVLLISIFVISPSFFSELFTKSSVRLLNYSREFVDPAPFTFNLENKKLQAFKNEDFEVVLSLNGRAIPSEVFLIAGERRYKVNPDEKGKYLYTFPKIQKPVDFYFEAAGFSSIGYQIEVIERPSLLSFNAYLSYPAYLGKPNEKWDNVGNLVVPEGTQIQWRFNTNQTDKLLLLFNQGKDTVEVRKKGEKTFEYLRSVRNSQSYQVRLKNKYSYNKEEINYYVNVIPDKFPNISVQEYQDTATYSFLSVGGSISDDYGFSRLQLFYKISRKNNPGQFKSIPIPVSPDQSIQNYYYQLDLSQLQLQPGDKIDYYAQVWDNDGVNGAKSAKTSPRQFKIPSQEELEEEIDESVDKAENQIDNTLQKAQKLQNDIKNLENKLLNKNQLDYQDKKQAEDILKRRDELSDEIKKLQEQNALLNQKQERFFENSERVQEKIDQLKNLMDQLLDEETKKLYEELQKLLEQNRNNDAVLDKLKDIEEKEQTLEKELERALEMFKQLQFEQKLEQTVENLQDLAKEQKELAKENLNEDKKEGKDKENSKENQKDNQNKDGKEDQENKDGKENENQEGKENQKDNQSPEEKQKELNEKFEDIKEDLKELEEMDQDLENPNGMEENNEQMQGEQKELSEKLQKILEQLQKNQNKKAGDEQKDAGQKMQKMAEQLGEMQSGMEMEMMMENMDDLRAILENLVTLSFDQEELMKEFRKVNLSDPRFITLAQQQLKLRDDAKIIEDSLTALSKRVFQIQSFVTRELTSMKGYMDESSDLIKQRKLGNATAQQQFAMTSMNNLALMLNDVLSQMQQAMQNAMAMPQNGKGKPQNSPSLSKLQQGLNQKIQELKKSGKSGRELSEELARLAAEQQRIRQTLRELEKMMGGDKEGKEQLSKQIQELMKQMEKNEEDLVNKKLENITQERQKEIETRLLESEKAVKERGEEEERKSEVAKKKQKQIPPGLNQYFKNKEKQIELLKTIPPALSPYYKKEVDEYFEKIDK
ncbi:MAG: DUF4175 family protein [Microscillaceae bacterium]|nr:DUF4175 family protein [Microscillaceae bacterium]